MKIDHKQHVSNIQEIISDITGRMPGDSYYDLPGASDTEYYKCETIKDKIEYIEKASGPLGCWGITSRAEAAVIALMIEHIDVSEVFDALSQ